MTKVRNINEAELWFLGNHEDSVICCKEGWEDRECSSYPEAVEYYRGIASYRRNRS